MPPSATAIRSSSHLWIVGMSDSLDTEIAIVGGGPAGAALAVRLARAGRQTVVFERWPEVRWRAAGVFASPLTRQRLRAVGLSATELERLIRPISGLVLESTDGLRCRLGYEWPHACGFDRVELDAALLEHARAAGAQVRLGAVVRSVQLPVRDRAPARLVASESGSGGPSTSTWHSRLVVGADGPQSLVARSAGVARMLPLRRAGITFHRQDPAAAAAAATDAMDGRFLFGPGWYAGIAPVPRGRVNVGIVIGETQLRRGLREAGGLARVVERILDQFHDPRDAWQDAPPTDELMVALPLAHRVSRAHGRGFLLVGDACGFIDPLSGEGLHRALVSSELAAAAIEDWSAGDESALEEYDRRLRARFRNKDFVSWLLQAFLAKPALLDYGLRRLAQRAGLRRTFTLALTEQVPASRVIDPLFLLQLLRP
jgi:flavin-dependent dehydrogenase